MFDSGTDISTYQTVDSELNSESYQAIGVEPSGSVFSLITPDGDAWTETGAFPVLLFNENGTPEEENPSFRQTTVKFTNGTATANFSSFTVVME